MQGREVHRRHLSTAGECPYGEKKKAIYLNNYTCRESCCRTDKKAEGEKKSAAITGAKRKLHG